MTRRPVRDESGAALVLVLLLVTVVALVIGAMLSLTDTSLRTTVAVRSQAAGWYGGEAAVDAAITQLRLGSFNNDPTSPSYPKCFGTTDTLALSNFYPGSTGAPASSAAVTCSPDPNTGAGGGLVPISGPNKPGNAILTTGSNPAEDGLNVKALNNSTPFVVHGSVVSSSNIRISNGSLQTNVGVYARTGCTGTIVSNPAPACATTPPPDPGYFYDPHYASPADTVPAYRPVPAIAAASCPGKVVTFQPGYYDDAAGLTALMAGGGSNPCRGSVWWFTPGTYYFDFHNGSNPLLSGGDLWTIGDGQLVAGTPTDASGAVLSRPQVPATVPGACQNPIKSVSALGVQFIFGGDSQLQVAGSADAELCGTYHSGRPPIVFYGLTAGAESPAAVSDRPLTAVTATDALFGNTASVPNLAAADALSASWTKAGNNAQTGTFTVDGFAPTLGTAPAGSVLTTAALVVKYANSGNTSQNSRSVVLTPRGASGAAGTPIAVPLPSTSSSGSQTATVDLLGGGTSALAAAFHSSGFSGASAAYSSTLKQAGTESVDTIQLRLGYTPPGFRAETTATVPGNCLASTYTGGSAGQCAVLSTSSSYHGRAYLQGTTYTPNAVIDLTLSNITAQVLRFGVISRSLWIKETGAISYIGPVIEVPDNSPGFGPGGTVVYLNAYLCEAAATCGPGTGKLRLRARVYLFDPSGSPSPPARQIIVQSWAGQR